MLAIAAVLTLRLYSTTHVEPIAPQPTGVPTGVLLVDRSGHVLAIPNLGSSQVVTEPGVQFLPGEVLAADGGRSIVSQPEGDLLVIDPEHSTLPRVLAPRNGSTIHVPGLGARVLAGFVEERGGRRIWLVTLPPGTSAWRSSTQPSELIPLDLDGQFDGRPISLPARTHALTVGRTGAYVFTGPDRGSSNWVTLERVSFDGKVHVVRIESDLSLDAGNGVVLWRPPTCRRYHCPLFVLDADTGRTTEIADTASKGRLAVSVGSARFSPDGRYVVSPLNNAATAEQVWQGYAVVDLRTGEITPVDATIHPNGRMTRWDDVGWSGDRLVWVSQDAHGSIIGGYDPTTGDSATTYIPRTYLRVLGALP
jgi:hypothetical protein